MAKKEEVTLSAQGDGSFLYGGGPFYIPPRVAERAGGVMLAILLPLVGVVVGLTVLWDALDRGFRGRPQDGVVMCGVRWFNVVTAKFNARFVKHPMDAYMVNTALLLGVVVPLLFAASLWWTLTYGFSLYLCVAYHIFRLGPYFMNFAYTYTLCHKEGHSRTGLWKEPYNALMRYWFNWWVGLFYGVMPSSFTFGHAINHHKYGNGPLDVVSTSDRPRDSFRNFLAYVPRWSLYALNFSTFRQFIFEKKHEIAFRIAAGTVYFVVWASFIFNLHPGFCLAYVIFPVGENILLLACVNWCWHAFVDPDTPDDPFVQSVTLLEGPINVLSEDYHVVHHQYPGVHWTSHVNMYKKHDEEYKTHSATMFRGTHVFELFFLIILRKYDKMAEIFVDASGKHPTHEDKVKLIQSRLRACWWGPHAKVEYKQKGWEGVNDTDGY